MSVNATDQETARAVMYEHYTLHTALMRRLYGWHTYRCKATGFFLHKMYINDRNYKNVIFKGIILNYINDTDTK